VEGVDLESNVGLVVFEQDVVLRLVLFDQIIFKDERLFLRADDDRFDRFDLLGEEGDDRAGVPALRIVLLHPRFQVLRFAYVEDLPLFVLHQVDAGAGWETRDIFHTSILIFFKFLDKQTLYSLR
jgi:hypothetical protein